MTITFSYLVTTFFTSHLSAELGLSANSIASYSDCMRLLIDYVCKRFNIRWYCFTRRVCRTEQWN